jgi:hypothetical protein
MDIQDRYPKLAVAIGLMQMDNGYCDEGGVVQALTRMEAEVLGTAEIRAAWVAEAETWCADQTPERLDAACAGERMQDPTPENPYAMARGIDEDVVYVPANVDTVLNYLFDNM